MLVRDVGLLCWPQCWSSIENTHLTAGSQCHATNTVRSRFVLRGIENAQTGLKTTSRGPRGAAARQDGIDCPIWQALKTAGLELKTASRRPRARSARHTALLQVTSE